MDVPACGPREALVAVAASLISTGTETAGYDVVAARRGMRNPSSIRRLVESLRDEGLDATRRKITAKREELTQLGYSGAGTVVAVGTEVRGLRSGRSGRDAGAPHAEYVVVNEHSSPRFRKASSSSRPPSGARLHCPPWRLASRPWARPPWSSGSGWWDCLPPSSRGPQACASSGWSRSRAGGRRPRRWASRPCWIPAPRRVWSHDPRAHRWARADGVSCAGLKGSAVTNEAGLRT